MKIIDAIAQGKRLVTGGRVLTITGLVSEGVYSFTDGQAPPQQGQIFVEPDDEENSDLVVVD